MENQEDIDLKIKKALSQHIDLNNSYKNMIRETLQEQKKKKIRKIRNAKVLATSCVCLVTITSIVYAKDISNWVQKFFNNNKGIDTAIENGYLSTTDMEYVNSEGINAKIDNFLMDDYNLSFTLSLQFEDNINLDEISRVDIPDIIITDEENRILYCENEDAFKKFCGEKKLDYKYNEFTENYIDGGRNCYIKRKTEDTKTIEIICNLQGEKFPRSRSINVDFAKIKISKQKDSGNKEMCITGKWNLDMNVPDKFYNREEIVYAIKSCNDTNICIDEFSVKDTGTKFEFHTKLDPIYYETDTEDVKKKRYEQFTGWYFKEIKENRALIINEYIEDNQGNKYYPSMSNTQNSKTKYEMSGEFKHNQIFNLTKYSITNKIKIHFILNLPSESKEIIIELERKEK